LDFDFYSGYGLICAIHNTKRKNQMINKLEVDSLILEFGSKRVLNNVYLKSETGKVSGLLGRNGSGKSCLMKILFGTLIPQSKTIRINKQSLINGYRAPADLRYLPQNRFIPGSLTIKRVFTDYGIDFAGFVTYFPEFEKLYTSKLHKLSGGEQRIIEIYTILLAPSKFCLLDEPFSQVMPVHVDTIKSLIVREKQNKGIIVSDHLYKHIIDLCDDLYVINEGKIYLASGISDLEKLGYLSVNEK
jgi:ABC-type multidrug transport system ATPase subunit